MVSSFKIYFEPTRLVWRCELGRSDNTVLLSRYISANKQCFAPNLLCLKLIKCNQRNWSRFKQTLKKSPLKPSDGCIIDQFEKRLDWCCEADGRAEAMSIGHNKQQTQQRSVKFLSIIKLFLDTPVQYKHDDFIKISDN